MDDRELLAECKRLAFSGAYDLAIDAARNISMPEFAVKAEFLVIELQVSRERLAKGEV